MSNYACHSCGAPYEDATQTRCRECGKSIDVAKAAMLGALIKMAKEQIAVEDDDE